MFSIPIGQRFFAQYHDLMIGIFCKPHNLGPAFSTMDSLFCLPKIFARPIVIAFFVVRMPNGKPFCQGIPGIGNANKAAAPCGIAFIIDELKFAGHPLRHPVLASDGSRHICSPIKYTAESKRRGV